MITHFQVTGRGQQALGEWPLFDQIASPETLALLLERLAEEAPSDEEANNLRKAATYARSLAAGKLSRSSESRNPETRMPTRSLAARPRA